VSRYTRQLVSAAAAYERARVRQLREAARQEQLLARQARAHAQIVAADEARERTEALEDRADELAEILAKSRGLDYRIKWDSLRVTPSVPPFQPGDVARLEPPPDKDRFRPRIPTVFERIIPFFKDSYQRYVDRRAAQFDEAAEGHAKRESDRIAKFTALRERHDALTVAKRREADEQNRALDDMIASYRKGEVEGVETMAEVALASDDLPEIASCSRAVFEAASKRLVIERELPTVDIVPTAESVRYVKSSGEFIEKKRSASSIRSIYNRLCAGIIVRTMRAVALGDVDCRVETIVVNGYVDTLDPATGRPTRPTLLSVSAVAEEVRALHIEGLDPIACLKRFGARISPNSQELEPVKPIIEFNMVDPRFVPETNVLGTLDTRPNLAELTPSEFESLMTNLFEKMGLETRQTRASRDGGVDCVAWDTRPVVGEKVVIQAKRYKNTVGVSAVRDLYGTMMNEHAAKGILVTTSGFGRAAYEFAKEKPMELVSGANLLALLLQYTNVAAKIEFPDSWADLASGVDA
jgi:restriction system protein